jgi:hypothetical protein
MVSDDSTPFLVAGPGRGRLLGVIVVVDPDASVVPMRL